MAFAGAAHKGAQKCLCHSRGPVLRSPALSGRSSLAALLREDRRRGRYNSPRRPSITTYVAAVEEAPSAQSAPSTSEEDEEFKFAIDFTNTDDLYKRFNELLERQSMDIKLGDKVTGTISSVDQTGAYVDFGGKQPLFCPTAEVSVCKLSKATQALQEGMTREFVVNHQDRKTGELRLSIKVLEQALLWQRLRQIYEEGARVEAKVESVRPAGIIASVFGAVTGFIPGSHISTGTGKSVDWNDLIGQTLQVKVLEADEEKDRLVMSNRQSSFGSSSPTYNIGDVVEGVVSTLQPYGAFINLGGESSGLLHISQISHDRISSVDQVLEVGQKIKVMIMTLDKEKGRVSLSTKKLEPTPGDMIRDPALVYRRADEMAAAFRERYLQAEKEARSPAPAQRQRQ